MAMEHLPEPQPSKKGSQWSLVVLIVLVMVLATVTFIRPIANTRQTQVVTQTSEMVATTEGTITPTIPAEAMPPTPDEVGYTDGIIFCSTVLVLILLLGTLRETAHRKGR